MVPYLMTSLFILTLPCEGSPVTLAKEIEESPTITAELNVVDAEENPVADVNVILDVDVGQHQRLRLLYLHQHQHPYRLQVQPSFYLFRLILNL